MKNLFFVVAVLVSVNAHADNSAIVHVQRVGDTNRYLPCFGDVKKKCIEDGSSQGTYIEIGADKKANVVFPKYVNFVREIGKLSYDGKVIELNDNYRVYVTDHCYDRAFAPSQVNEYIYNQETRRRKLEDCTTYMIVKLDKNQAVGKYFIEWDMN